MDGASLGKEAWPFSAEMAKPEVPINLPTDTISAVRYRGLCVGAQGITEALSHLQTSIFTSNLFTEGNSHQGLNVQERRKQNASIYPLVEAWLQYYYFCNCT